jgi:hypothetical protein
LSTISFTSATLSSVCDEGPNDEFRYPEKVELNCSSLLVVDA